jgi:hypothetical protein
MHIRAGQTIGGLINVESCPTYRVAIAAHSMRHQPKMETPNGTTRLSRTTHKAISAVAVARTNTS